MDDVNARTVGEVARRSNVSVRTLHHYDEIGLLSPRGRSEAGYRLYAEDDVARLRQILFYRELDFGLDEIRRILADPDSGSEDHLRRQHALLRERRARADALITAIENEMEARRMGLSLTPEEQLEVFGTADFARHQAEAERRWGESAAWRESARRTAAYTKQDWLAIRAEADANVADFARAIEVGEPADGPVAAHLAEQHRAHLTRWFYDCSPRMHVGIAELYLSDPRYTATWEEIAPGFSRYVHDAIVANARGRQAPGEA